MEQIIGIDLAVAVFTIVGSGVLIGQFLKWKSGESVVPYLKIGIITGFSSIAAVFATIYALPVETDISLQWIIFIGEIGAIAGLEYVATRSQRVISKLKA